MILLSIIIPYYNAEPYTSELLDRLAPQINDKVEVIVIDDGSRQPFETDYEWVKIIRQENWGCSSARNAGLDRAKGKFVSFIDADDLVPEYYVSKILEKTKEDPDVIEFSWKSLNTNMWNLDHKLNSDNERLSNPSVCTRAFKRAFIGDIRFNEQKDSTEDEDFSRKVGYIIPLGKTEPIRANKTVVIPDYMYFYRDDVDMSKTKRFAEGLMRTKRVVYYYDHVTMDMGWLVDEIRREDQINEVWLMTNQCDLEGLDKYCRTVRPQRMWGHILRGEKTELLTLKKPPVRTQIVIYRKNLFAVSGLASFIRNFVDAFCDKYDITIVANYIHQTHYRELVQKVRVITNVETPIVCDTLIVPSFLDHLPKTIIATHTVRMCHACRTDLSWHIPEDSERVLYVSDTAKRSFDAVGETVHNICFDRSQKALILVSATRLPAPDKGDIENRMRRLADMLNSAAIPFVWLNYSDGKLPDPPKNFINCPPTKDIQSIMKKADYVVSLSDSECWSFTVLESLQVGTPLIITGYPSAFEMGIEDGVNAHVVPFDMDFDVRILLDIPKFEYKYDNKKIIKQWQQILGKPKDYPKYEPPKLVEVQVIQDYTDMLLDKDLVKGTRLIMEEQRAQVVRDAGYITILS